MTRSPLASPPLRPAARAARRPATRQPDLRYCESPSRPVRGGATSLVRPAGRALPAAQPVRLTALGRVLLVLVAAVLLLTVFSLGRVTSNASTGARPRTTVVIQTGETVWQVARRIAPRADPRITVDRILRLNHLRSADEVRTGQELVLPN
jgi:nucleoid-associated protein YgaU